MRVQVMMQDPVIAADGHTYERDAMTTWLQQHHISPVAGQLLKHTRLVSNLAVKWRMIGLVECMHRVLDLPARLCSNAVLLRMRR